eukprot:3935598-Rhodomonas_salina.2
MPPIVLAAAVTQLPTSLTSMLTLRLFDADSPVVVAVNVAVVGTDADDDDAAADDADAVAVADADDVMLMMLLLLLLLMMMMMMMLIMLMMLMLMLMTLTVTVVVQMRLFLQQYRTVDQLKMGRYNEESSVGEASVSVGSQDATLTALGAARRRPACAPLLREEQQTRGCELTRGGGEQAGDGEGSCEEGGGRFASS